MLESPDHAPSVTRRVTGYNRAFLGRITRCSAALDGGRPERQRREVAVKRQLQQLVRRHRVNLIVAIATIASAPSLLPIEYRTAWKAEPRYSQWLATRDLRLSKSA